MSTITYGPFKIGYDSQSPEGGLPQGALADAINVNLNRTGEVSRRPGRAIGLTQAGMHSLWTSPATGDSYCVVNGVLCSVACDGSTVTTTTLLTLTDDEPVSFDDLLDGVVFSNIAQVGTIFDGVATTIGVEDPAQPSVGNSATGSLPAGRYGVAVSFVVGSEESGLSPASFVDLAEGQGLSVAVPQPTESNVNWINLYRTETGDEVLRLAATIPIGISTYLLGAGQIGRIADNQYQERILPGRLVRYWRGRIVIASGANLYFSQAMRYGRFDRRTDFIQFPRDITLLETVEGGVWVGTDDGVVFLAGDKPANFTQRRTTGKAPIAYSGTRIQSGELGGDYGEGIHALWLARNGFVLGTSGGSLLELNPNRLTLPSAQWAGFGSTVVHQRRVITTLN